MAGLMTFLKRHAAGFVRLAAVLALSGIADAGADSQLIVQAEVAPSISVSTYASVVDLGSVTTGDFSGIVTFSVKSNTPRVTLQVLATDLYKDSNPSSTQISPITVNQGAGVRIQAAAAHAIDGSGGVAVFRSNETLNKPQGPFNAYKTNAVTLESTQQGGVFNQDVDVQVTWTQGESIKPAGTYGGYIVLYASLVN